MREHARVNRAEIALTAEAAAGVNMRGKTCVVLDVLRASTTIIAALASGCPFVIPVETPEEARAAAKARGALLGGERGGLKIEGFDFGNSPLEYTAGRIRNRPLAFTTTNGTRAIRACTASARLYVAAFVNAGVVRVLLERETRDIAIVCAGTRGEPSIEDTVCGGMLLESLAYRGDEAEEAVSLWRKHKGDLATMMKRVSAHGRSLMQLGFEADLDFAATLDAFDIIAARENDTIVNRKDQ